jgi:hypothetical protein
MGGEGHHRKGGEEDHGLLGIIFFSWLVEAPRGIVVGVVTCAGWLPWVFWKENAKRCRTEENP